MIRISSVCLFFMLQVHAIKGTGLCNTPSPAMPDTSVLYIFIGSDWCSNCGRLEKYVLKDSGFIKAMATNYVKIELLDFPQRKKLPKETSDRNKALAEKYGFNGTFPTLVMTTGDSGKFSIFYFGNESATDFTYIILKEQKKINE